MFRILIHGPSAGAHSAVPHPFKLPLAGVEQREIFEHDDRRGDRV
jgi:hypothetical protein